MPPRRPPTLGEFDGFCREMLGKGFVGLFPREVAQRLRLLRSFSPRKREGRETGLIFRAHSLEVTVWTTFLQEEREFREQDCGWVIITSLWDLGILYCSRPIHRTKNFLSNLLRQAEIARLRVLRRPYCPRCSSPSTTQCMDIVKGRGMKSRFWRCPCCRSRVDWDTPIRGDLEESSELFRYLNGLRRRRGRYLRSLRKKGKPTFSAMKRRRPWRTSGLD